MKLFFLLGLLAPLVLSGISARAADKNAVAVIIGNTDYAEGLPAVDYAGRDADAFKAFVTDVLGYDPENIIDLRNTTKAEMEAAFGNERTAEGKLWRYLDPRGKSNVMVFYSGHGVPGLKDKRGYLLPVNADANSPEINGYPIDTLLENLAKLEAKSIAVFLDACFSGNSAKGMLINATSGITISAKMPDKTRGNLVVLSAARGDQVASWDTEAQHGLFTRHLLEALYGAADTAEYGDGDGNITLVEVKNYLDDLMTRRARRLWGRHQNADMRGEGSTILASVVTGKVPPVVAVDWTTKPGTVFKDCSLCPEMVVVPPGEFVMSKYGANFDEFPPRLVKFGHSFAVGRFEITVDNWNACVNDGACERSKEEAQTFGRERYPITNVSFNAANNYVNWLSEKTGKRYRLPTDSEWEHAARVGSKTRYSYGNLVTKSEANVFGQSAVPVGRYPANAAGLYDVHGNVWEWTEKCEGNNTRISTSTGVSSGRECSAGDLRGRSWTKPSSFYTSFYVDRRSLGAVTTSHDVGFRVVRNLE